LESSLAHNGVLVRLDLVHGAFLAFGPLELVHLGARRVQIVEVQQCGVALEDLLEEHFKV